MSVENDGLPLDDSDAEDTYVDVSSADGTRVARRITDPLTEPLPLSAAVPSSGVPTDALDLANVNAAATAVPPAPTESATHGSLEGDLFDGVADR
jgi:hypothetical protein